jgi:hypothetical protein
MSQTKNQQSRQDMQHGHQDEPPKKGENPNDPQNRQAEHPQKQGVNDFKEGQQRQGIGTPHAKTKSSRNPRTVKVFSVPSSPLPPACTREGVFHQLFGFRQARTNMYPSRVRL